MSWKPVFWLERRAPVFLPFLCVKVKSALGWGELAERGQVAHTIQSYLGLSHSSFPLHHHQAT